MHPFLPLLSLVFVGMADAVMYFVWKHGNDMEVVTHRPSLWALIAISLLFGGGLAFWLKRFHIRFPLYFALASVVWVIILIIFRSHG